MNLREERAKIVTEYLDCIKSIDKRIEADKFREDIGSAARQLKVVVGELEDAGFSHKEAMNILYSMLESVKTDG